jgi:hypothetical protein
LKQCTSRLMTRSQAMQFLLSGSFTGYAIRLA